MVLWIDAITTVRFWTVLLLMFMWSPTTFAQGLMQVSPKRDGNCYSARWSPEGDKVSYEVHFPKKEMKLTYLLELANRKEELVEADAGPSIISNFEGGKKPPVIELDFAPKGGKFCYSATGNARHFDIYIHGEGKVTTERTNEHQCAWSPQFKNIAYAAQREGGGDLFLIDIFELEKKPQRLTFTPNATEYQPRWNPGGKSLLFAQYSESKGDHDIYLITDLRDPKGTIKQITGWKGDELTPSWAPKGDKIAFFSNKDHPRAGKVFDLYFLDISTGESKKVAKDVVKPDRGGPVWTPDGKFILYVDSDNKIFDPIFWVNLETEERGKLKTGTQMNDDLVLFKGSTGGLRLVFTAQARTTDKKKTWKKVYIFPFTVDHLRND